MDDKHKGLKIGRSILLSGLAAALMVLTGVAGAEAQLTAAGADAETTAGPRGQTQPQSYGPGVEVGLFGPYTVFDDGVRCVCNQPTNDVGLGLRVGAGVSSHLLVEGDVSSTTTTQAIVGGDLRQTSAAMRLAVRRSLWEGLDPREAVAVQAGLGPVHTWLDGTRRWGASGQLGVQWTPLAHLALRLDGFADYHPDEETLDRGARLGLSLILPRERRP